MIRKSGTGATAGGIGIERAVFVEKESQAEEVNPERLKEELADVLTYSLLLAEKHHLDIFDIVLEKSGRTGRNIR